MRLNTEIQRNCLSNLIVFIIVMAVLNSAFTHVEFFPRQGCRPFCHLLAVEVTP